VAGKLRDCRFCQLLLAIMSTLFVMTILIVTNVWNPIPQLAAWWDRFTALSSPPPPWTQRLGGPPVRTAVMAGGEAVATFDGSVVAYDGHTGEQKWQFNAFWGLPARDVVVLRQQGTNPDNIGSADTGYDVVNADTGKVMWGQRDAQAVWAYDDQIIDLVCSDTTCTMRGFNHFGGGQLMWTIPLPLAAHAIHGADPDLVGTRDPAAWFDQAQGGNPGLLPRVLGLKVDDQIHILDTLAHADLRQIVPDLQTEVSLTNQTLVLTSATPDGSGCHYSVRGFNALTGAVDFPSMDVDVGTVDGAGCGQHEQPIGAHGWLVAKDPRNNTPQLIDAATGDIRWTGVASERVLATDGQLAAILTADRHTIKVIDLLITPAEEVWSQSFGLDPQAAITSTNVIVRDGDQEHLLLLNHELTGSGIQWKTQSVVVGYGPDAVVIASGRRIGVLFGPASTGGGNVPPVSAGGEPPSANHGGTGTTGGTGSGTGTSPGTGTTGGTGTSTGHPPVGK
jgi:outer membrane protein assembly factor BamB